MAYIYFTFLLKFVLNEGRYFTADFTNTYLILINRKFNKKQLLLETFFPKNIMDLIGTRPLIAHLSLYTRLKPTCDKKIGMMGLVYILNVYILNQ